MIVHDVKQGGLEWLRLRSGIPTASEFHKIVTPMGESSSQADRYLCDLIAERILGRPLEAYVSLAMERGSELESEAISAYEFERDLDTFEVGIITDDKRLWGASPDRLVGDDGLLEIKCPDAGVHVSYLLMLPASRKYYPQIQGQLWITRRKWVDIMSYHPEMNRAIVRVERDEDYLQLLSKVVTSFSGSLEVMWSSLSESVKGKGARKQDPMELLQSDAGPVEAQAEVTA